MYRSSAIDRHIRSAAPGPVPATKSAKPSWLTSPAAMLDAAHEIHIESKETGKTLAVDTTEGRYVRPTARAGRGEDVRNAVAIDVAESRRDAAEEVRVKCGQGEPRRAVDIDHLNNWRLARGGSDQVDFRNRSQGHCGWRVMKNKRLKMVADFAADDAAVRQPGKSTVQAGRRDETEDRTREA